MLPLSGSASNGAGANANALAGAILAAAAAAAACQSHRSEAKCVGAELPSAALEHRLAELEADVGFPGRTTNSAFVFVKPAAVTPAALQLVEASFKKFGIKITGSGTLDAKTIDEQQLIDTHYGAIASKVRGFKLLLMLLRKQHMICASKRCC